MSVSRRRGRPSPRSAGRRRAPLPCPPVPGPVSSCTSHVHLARSTGQVDGLCRLGSTRGSEPSTVVGCAMIGSTFEGPFGSLRGLADPGGETTTATSRRRSAAPATAFATVVLIVVLSCSPPPYRRAASRRMPAPRGNRGDRADGGGAARRSAARDRRLAPAGGDRLVSGRRARAQRFAIAKATEGRGYVDPMYATNEAGAALSGIVFGAYHFAKPDETRERRDPRGRSLRRRRAARTRQPGAGARHRADRRAYAGGGHAVDPRLARPRDRAPRCEADGLHEPARLGARTGDTTAVADAGYTMLWVAHWGVASPTVPGANWRATGGRSGSTVTAERCRGSWGAWTSTGTRPARSSRSRSRAPDVTPPAVTITLAGDLAGPLTVAFSEVVHQVTPDKRALPGGSRARDEDGLDSPAARARVSTSTALDGSVRVALVEPNTPLIPGETYEAVVNLPGALPARGRPEREPGADDAAPFATPTELEQDSPAVSYGWRTVSTADAQAAPTRWSVTRVPRRPSRSPDGRSPGSRPGPTQGKAGGVDRRTSDGVFDQYSARQVFGVARTSTGSRRGEQWSRCGCSGRPRPPRATRSSRSTRSGPGATASRSRTWTRRGARRRGSASGGSYVASDLKGSSLELTFRGTGILVSPSEVPAGPSRDLRGRARSCGPWTARERSRRSA